MIKNGIALLITLMFILLIGASIALGLKNIKDAQDDVRVEKFLFQSGVIINDVLSMLKSKNELSNIKTDADLYAFLALNSFLSLRVSNYDISIELNSARGRFNINSLYDAATKEIDVGRVDILKYYFSQKGLNSAYVDILIDGLKPYDATSSYNSNIFYDKVNLYHGYILSRKHLGEYNEYYQYVFDDNSVNKIDFDKIFYYSKDRSLALDVNFFDKEMWMMILGVDEFRASQLVMGSGSYTEDNPPKLGDDEKDRLSKFNIGYNKLYLDVKVTLKYKDKIAYINFEYDIKEKKGYNFSYEI